ncbi:DUF1702 family protein [Tsukamurella sp. 8F]|uniref:DUF1702 family protein n=1 Tax=unclassified Tsukamurella TaxID=2633480 RepID=UPI0023B96A8B|nr:MULTISPECIES: DUF1702 family protein [unclassified Tsukamurella]MDF0531676.1 DUF1702 family protein [Tsukamurella sp. 8J]MDF0588922.1 DUF1702 family protein [Tsukamurella sp. 8F]
MSATRLKHIVYTVHECCETTILNPRFESLVPKLEAYDDELQGFAYEGAGVGLAALDCMFPRSDRTRALATGPGAHHVFGIYLGAGMCLARIRKNPESFRQKLGDPLMSWTVLDGYGFYRGFFHYDRFVTQKHVPPHLQGYGRRVYDQGLGRAIWFSADADVELVATTIEAFLPQRQADLWSGVGFACGYSGGIEREALEPLPDLAGVHRAHLAVGAAIAAKARYLGGNPAPHNDLACDLLCGSTAKEASDVVDDAVVNLPPGVDVPAHALWRQRVLQEFL